MLLVISERLVSMRQWMVLISYLKSLISSELLEKTANRFNQIGNQFIKWPPHGKPHFLSNTVQVRISLSMGKISSITSLKRSILLRIRTSISSANQLVRLPFRLVKESKNKIHLRRKILIGRRCMR